MKRIAIALLATCISAHAQDTAFFDQLFAQVSKPKVSAPSALWTPTNMTSLEAWYAVEDGTMWQNIAGTVAASQALAVVRWDDKSGNNRHMTNTTPLQALVYYTNEWDNLSPPGPVIAGNADQGNIAYYAKTYTQQTVFVAFWRQSTTEAYGRLISQNTSSGNDYDAGKFIPFHQNSLTSTLICSYNSVCGENPVTSFTNGEHAILGLVHNGTSFNHFKNGTTSVTVNCTLNLNSAWTSIMIYNPATTVARMSACVVETVIGSAALSESERQKLEGYLAHKWGLTNSLPAGHPYKTTKPTQ